jgi:hypothetical protein
VNPYLVAFTLKLRSPAASPAYVCGLEQGVNVGVSSAHVNVAPGQSVNVNVAVVSVDGFDGFAVIDGAGGVRLTVQLYEVAALSLFAESFASTLNVWFPCASPPYGCGLVHAVNAALSSEQRYVTPDWLSANENDADCVSLLGFAGLDVMAGAGGFPAPNTAPVKMRLVRIAAAIERTPAHAKVFLVALVARLL